ncbi:MAG: hypothetical protein L0Z73_05475 [Gammaproteobacteria bacterium]|nr:hypothetical protein [Gammaproteobacteria bacterium]
MASQLIIKSPQPRKTAMIILLTVIAFVGVGYGMYYYGHNSSGFDYEAIKISRSNMQQQLYEIEKENSKLRERNAVLEQASIIDKKAQNDVNGSIKRLQDEVLELKEQVAFYRGIVSPAQTASGLNITSFKLNKLGDVSGYHFRLVLTQIKQNNQIIRGKANILIDGLQNGEPKQLNISDIMGKAKDDMNLQFKYFQTIEGDMVLPEGFVPSSVLVDIKPSGSSQNSISRIFNWTDIIS